MTTEDVGIDPVLTRKETAQALRICIRTLTRLEQERKLPPRIKLSDRLYGYRRSAIEQYLASRTVA
jgi:predicted DNA-binding transcriptional regulator AlpA